MQERRVRRKGDILDRRKKEAGQVGGGGNGFRHPIVKLKPVCLGAETLLKYDRQRRLKAMVKYNRNLGPITTTTTTTAATALKRKRSIR